MKPDLDHGLVAQRLVEIAQGYDARDTQRNLLFITKAINHLAMQCTHETPGPKGRRFMFAGEMRSVAARLEYLNQYPTNQIE